MMLFCLQTSQHEPSVVSGHVAVLTVSKASSSAWRFSPTSPKKRLQKDIRSFHFFFLLI